MEPTLCIEIVNEIPTFQVDQQFLNTVAMLQGSRQPITFEGRSDYVCTTRWGGFECYEGKGKFAWTGAIGAELTAKGDCVLLVGAEWMRNTGSKTVRDAEFDRCIFGAGNIDRAAKATGNTIAGFKALPLYQQRSQLIDAWLKEEAAILR
jgi:hypothetical protein